MKKLYFLFILVATVATNAQTTISQWNFDNTTPATAMLPNTGSGTFTTIGGVVDNVTSGVMPSGNPNTTGNLSYSVKGFPAAGTASGTAGFQFAVSTVGFNDPINVVFDTRGSGTSSKWQQYQYTTDGTNWITLSNNNGGLTQTFATVALTFPTSCGNNANFGFRIVSIFNPTGTDYAPITSTSTYAVGGNWRVDNVTFSSGILGINKNSIDGLKMYPNPVSNGILYITTDANAEKNIAIFDLLGKQVLATTTSNSQVNVNNLSAGVYMVKITEEGKTATRKLIIN